MAHRPRWEFLQDDLSEQFKDDFFRQGLRQWLKEGRLHDQSHVRPLGFCRVSQQEEALGSSVAKRLQREKAIMGVFDEGMGTHNAIIPDELLHPTGVFMSEPIGSLCRIPRGK